MKRILDSNPMLPAAVFLCVGICLGYYGASMNTFLLVGLIGILLFGFIILFKAKVTTVVLIPAFLGATGGFTLGIASHPLPLPEEVVDRYGTLYGTVEKVVRTPETLRLVVNAERWVDKKDSTDLPVDFKALATIRSARQDIIPGTRVVLRGKIKDLEFHPDVPFQTDYNRFLFIDGVVGRIAVYSTEDYSFDTGEVGSFSKFLHDVRQKWLSAIVSAGFDEPTTTFMLAVLGGDSLLLSDNMEEQFRQSGLSHLLAISGMHVGIILFILAFILYPVKLSGRLRPFYFIGLAFLICMYAVAAGASPSVLRAALMCCVFLGCRLFEVRTSGLQGLSVAVVVLLCIEPLWLFLPGFQLSVCAVLAILSCRRLLDAVPGRFGLLRALWNIALLPVIAIAGTVVLTVFYFHGVAVDFWLSNIVAAVFIPVLIIAGFITCLFSLFGLTSALMCGFTDTVYRGFRNAVDIVSSLFPDSYVPVFLDGISLIIIGLLIVAAFLVIRFYSHLRAACLAVAVALCFFMVPVTEAETPVTELYVPVHYDNTDVMIVHKGRNYVWTSAADSTELKTCMTGLKNRYSDFYRSRRVKAIPEQLLHDFEEEGLEKRGNLCFVGGRTIVRIDNEECIPPFHVDAALVSEKFAGSMHELVQRLDADTVYLSAAINYSRHQKFVRQLDQTEQPYRSLKNGGLIWQVR